MNVIFFKGGLGNQMWQYAFGQAKKNLGQRVYFNIDWYNRQFPQTSKREYGLHRFNCKVDFHDILTSKTIRDKKKYYPRYLSLNGYNWDGYWQYMQVVNPVLDLLREDFTLKLEYLSDENYKNWLHKINSRKSVAIHVRRTDYEQAFGTLPFSYFFKALTHTKGDIFIFSDDMAWCHSHFNQKYFDRKIHFPHLDDYFDFELMKHCSHHIISHSTFSLWAALLNENPDQVVVCPQFWLGKGINDIPYMEKWIKI